MSLKNFGKNLGNTVKTAQQKHERLPSAKRVLRLDDIQDRPHGDTREINDEHVDELMESIAALGLIQPLAVDQNGYLLAGGHRRIALHYLRDDQPEVFEEHFPGGQIPVRVFEFDAAEDEELAIAIEATENEKRRDYTTAEIKELADRLVKAGYRDVPGRPKKGEKRLLPTLSNIVGKSTRTVRRHLNEEPEEKTRPNGRVSSSRVLKEKAVRILEELRSHPDYAGRGGQEQQAMLEEVLGILDELPVREQTP